MRRTASQPIGEDAEWARGVIARAWQSDIGSSDNEVRFLMDMDRGLDCYGARMFVSQRQRAWLERIERRLDGEEAEEETGGVKPVDEVLR